MKYELIFDSPDSGPVILTSQPELADEFDDENVIADIINDVIDNHLLGNIKKLPANIVDQHIRYCNESPNRTVGMCIDASYSPTTDTLQYAVIFGSMIYDGGFYLSPMNYNEFTDSSVHDNWVEITPLALSFIPDDYGDSYTDIRSSAINEGDYDWATYMRPSEIINVTELMDQARERALAGHVQMG